MLMEKDKDGGILVPAGETDPAFSPANNHGKIEQDPAYPPPKHHKKHKKKHGDVLTLMQKDKDGGILVPAGETDPAFSPANNHGKIEQDPAYPPPKHHKKHKKHGDVLTQYEGMGNDEDEEDMAAGGISEEAMNKLMAKGIAKK